MSFYIMITLTVATGIAVYFGVQKEDSRKASSSVLPLDTLIENKREINDESPLNTGKYFEIKDDTEKVSREKSHMKIIARAEKAAKEKKEQERLHLEEEKRKAEEAKLVQLRKEEDKWETYEITMYTAGYESTQKRKGEPGYGITASGNYVQEGVTIACSPEISFGTQIYIEELNHTYTCSDRGSAVTFGKIDVYVQDLDKAINFGRIKSRIKFVN